jgi:hypothetical protein
MVSVRRFSITAAIALSMAVLTSLPASALTFSDIAGKWCTGAGIAEFAQRTLTIVRSSDGARSVYAVHRYEYTDRTIVVHWVRWDNKETTTEYGDFSADRRSMMQFQTSDGGLRREHLRC